MNRHTARNKPARKTLILFFILTFPPALYLIPEVTIVFSMDFCMTAKMMKLGRNRSSHAAAEAPCLATVVPVLLVRVWM